MSLSIRLFSHTNVTVLPSVGHDHWAQVKVCKATGSHGEPVSWEMHQEEEGKEGPGFKGDRHYIQIFRDTNTYWQHVPRGKTFTSLPLHSPPLLVRQVHRGIASEEKRQKQLCRRGNGREHSLGFSPAVKEGVLTQIASLRSSPACAKVTGYGEPTRGEDGTDAK